MALFPADVEMSSEGAGESESDVAENRTGTVARTELSTGLAFRCV